MHKKMNFNFKSPKTGSTPTFIPPSSYDILIRFCFGKIAIISDIQQAFLNVEICEQDKNFLRFLYVNPNDDAEIQMYRFNRVCFGIASSPFLLSATIKHHMNMLKTEQPELTDKFMSGIYVDDITSTVNTVDEFAKQAMASAGLHLRKWFSNSKELCGRMGCIQDDLKLRKVLGVSWNVHNEFVFDFRSIVAEALKMPLAKRNILRVGAKFFDPMGMISPIVIIAKIYFQKVCLLNNIYCDDQLPDDIATGWRNYLQQLASIKRIVIPRYFFCDTVDSSNQAYCAVIYAQAETGSGTISRIITSKTKVAPIKKLSIPHLELLSCLLLSELMSNLCELQQHVIIVDRKYLWSASEVALAWMKGEGKIWKPWVQNRVNKIKEVSDVDDWQYVNTKVNPADIATREGSIVKFPKNDLWWYGPNWEKCCTVPVDRDVKGDVIDVKKKQSSKEVNSALVCLVDSSKDKSNNQLKNGEVGFGGVVKFERHSNLMKLLRIIAYILRFINNCSKSTKISGEICAEETGDALKRCIRWEQISIATD